MSDTIVVGVDGSDGAEQAVRWAARLAAQHGLELRIVHGMPTAELHYGGGIAGAADLVEALREDGDRIVNAAVRIASAVDQNLVVITEVVAEMPIPLLIERSRRAQRIVLGHSGRGGITGALVGTTATAVIHHAHCPVAVIRGRVGATAVPEVGPVVLGVDGSPASEQAIPVAFEEASWRAVDLVAVHVWSDFGYDDPYGAMRLLPEWPSLEGEQILAERLAGWQEKYPDVGVHREVVKDRPRRALLDWSQRAQLMVLGSRGRGGFLGMLLGSTSRALVQHAGCPVLVVRPAPGA